MRATGSGVISIGPFVQVPVEFYKASEAPSLRDNLHSVCECGEKPKQTIACPKCERVYGSSWSRVPLRAFDAGGGTNIVLSTEEIAAAKSDKTYDAMSVEKVVPFQPLAARYILTEPRWVLPKKESPSPTLRAYRLVVEALAHEGRAMLTRLTLRGGNQRLALVPDTERNVLVAYTVLDAREPPSVPREAPDAALLEQARNLLAGVATDDLTFPADPDPIEALLSGKIDALLNEGLKTGVEA